MHSPKQPDQVFDAFRRERKRVRAKLGPQDHPLGYDNQALRELEEVEAREVREQQLTREVHEFFAAATRQAAAIVEKVSQDAEAEQGIKVQNEVEGFLIDALSRMNTFVVSAMKKRRHPDIAETEVLPDVKHLVGPELDEFRAAGSPETRDAHLGQDPFDTDLEEVQREFREVCGDEPVTAAEPAYDEAQPIEDHLVAEEPSYQDVEPELEVVEEMAEEVVEAVEQSPEPAADAPAVGVGPELAAEQEELENFKNALKALVRQGVMQKEEARAAWMTRLEALSRR